MQIGFDKALLEGKTALVTGAGKGIGKACVEQLVAAGCHVVAVARTQADLDILVQSHPNKVTAWAMDAASTAFFERIATLSELDIVVNNVGANQPEPIGEVAESTLDWLINLNIKSIYMTSQAAVRHFDRTQTQGSIINISSQMGHIGSPNRTVYCMTKHAIEGLTKALAVETAKRGIRVNSIAPTFIETSLTEPMFAKPEFKEFVLNKIPLGKIGQPNDVAHAVVYLASDLSKLVTGMSLKVDGGWTAE